MSQGSNSNETVTVSNDGITVEKTVTADEFPVPAVVFVIRCDASTPAHVRLTDRIPESFPMERVGFHPEFESDRWTAYKDHRVEFERELDAGEEIKTVYGIRSDDTGDLSAFLTEPSVKELSQKEQEEATDIEGILGPDNSQMVRDVLAGNRSSLPGVDDQQDPLSPEAADPLGDANGVSAEHVSETVDTDNTETEPATETVAVNEGELSVDDEPAGPASVETEPFDVAADADEQQADDTPSVDAEERSDDERANAEEPLDEAAVDETATVDESLDDTPIEESDSVSDDSDDTASMDSQETPLEPQPASDDSQTAITAEPAVDGEVDDSSSVVTVQGGIAAVLAAELRNDNVSEEDRALLEKELGSAVPRSLEVRLNRVQSQVEDLSAYTDALEAFINENGTAKDIFGDLREDVTALSTEIDEISVELDSAAGERADLSADLASVRTGLNDIEREVEQFDERVETTESSVDDLGERVESAETTAADTADKADKLDTSVSQLSRDVESVTETADNAEADAEKAISTATSADETAEAAADAVDELDADIEHAFAEISDVGESVDDLETRVTDLDSEFEEVDDDIAEVHDDLDALDSTIRSSKRKLRAEIDELSERLDELDELETKADAGELDAVGDRVAELEAEIDALQTFRSQLSSAFGGVGGDIEE